ncbi:MAG: transposase, partial [Deltaproteobacteria bacterium]|nr:transposase [Deltaproteobacteria bacterium]
AMHYKVKEEGRIVPKAIYTILGVNQKGLKEALGIYVSEAEGANFWLQPGRVGNIFPLPTAIA